MLSVWNSFEHLLIMELGSMYQHSPNRQFSAVLLTPEDPDHSSSMSKRDKTAVKSRVLTGAKKCSSRLWKTSFFALCCQEEVAEAAVYESDHLLLSTGGKKKKRKKIEK